MVSGSISIFLLRRVVESKKINFNLIIGWKLVWVISKKKWPYWVQSVWPCREQVFMPKKALGQVVPHGSVRKLAQWDAPASIPREGQALRWLVPAASRLSASYSSITIHHYKLTKANSISLFLCLTRYLKSFHKTAV